VNAIQIRESKGKQLQQQEYNNDGNIAGEDYVLSTEKIHEFGDVDDDISEITMDDFDASFVSYSTNESKDTILYITVIMIVIVYFSPY